MMVHVLCTCVRDMICAQDNHELPSIDCSTMFWTLDLVPFNKKEQNVRLYKQPDTESS